MTRKLAGPAPAPPVQEARSLAPHVLRGIGRGAAPAVQRQAAAPASTVRAPHVAAVIQAHRNPRRGSPGLPIRLPRAGSAVVQRAASDSEPEDEEIAAIMSGAVAKRTLTDLKALLASSFEVQLLDQAVVPLTADETNDLYGFGVALSSGRAPRGWIYENEYKGKFGTGAAKAIAKLMFSKTAAWDFSTVSASGQPVLGYSATTWDTMRTITF